MRPSTIPATVPVAALLGHANSKITLERYVRWIKGTPPRQTMEDPPSRFSRAGKRREYDG